MYHTQAIRVGPNRTIEPGCDMFEDFLQNAHEWWGVRPETIETLTSLLNDPKHEVSDDDYAAACLIIVVKCYLTGAPHEIQERKRVTCQFQLKPKFTEVPFGVFLECGSCSVRVSFSDIDALAKRLGFVIDPARCGADVAEWRNSPVAKPDTAEYSQLWSKSNALVRVIPTSAYYALTFDVMDEALRRYRQVSIDLKEDCFVVRGTFDSADNAYHYMSEAFDEGVSMRAFGDVSRVCLDSRIGSSKMKSFPPLTESEYNEIRDAPRMSVLKRVFPQAVTYAHVHENLHLPGCPGRDYEERITDPEMYEMLRGMVSKFDDQPLKPLACSELRAALKGMVRIPRGKTNFMLVIGADLVRMKESKYARNSVIQVESQFNWLSGRRGPVYTDISKYHMYEKFRDTSLAFLTALALRDVQFSNAVIREIQPSFIDIEQGQALEHGFCAASRYDDNDAQMQMAIWDGGDANGNLYEELKYLAQTSYFRESDEGPMDGGSSFATQVFCSAMSLEYSTFRRLAQFPIDRSYEFCFLLTRFLSFARNMPINLHLTLLGTGALMNPLSSVIDAIAEFAPLLADCGCNVFIHAPTYEEANEIMYLLSPSVNVESMTSSDFFA